MRRAILFFGLPMCALLLFGCDTELDQPTAEGIWDSVGELQEVTGGVKLYLNSGPDGTVTGQWQRGASSSSVSGAINENGSVQLILTGFSGGQAAQFQGEFTDPFRMEGTLVGVELSGSAIFRRSSFSP